MKLTWSPRGWADLDRIHAFLAERDLEAADEISDALARAPDSLLEFPRLGSRLTRYDPREIRELRRRGYILRYELVGADIVVLRIFHAREDR